MTRFRSLIALFAVVVGAAMFPAAASADSSTPMTLTYVFTDCEGPAGTPAEFRAVKQPGEGAALHLTDGSGNFIAVRAVDVETGTVLFTTRGFERNGLPTVTCTLVNPRNGRTQLVTGLITPVG